MATAPRPDGMGMTSQPAGTTMVTPEGSNLDQAFVADRAIFWGRFTGFVKLGMIAIMGVLLFLLIFIY